jgi:hypothetical protein
MYLIYLHQTVYLQIGGAAQIIVGIFVAAAFGGQHQDNRDGKLGPWGMQVYIWWDFKFTQRPVWRQLASGLLFWIAVIYLYHATRNDNPERTNLHSVDLLGNNRQMIRVNTKYVKNWKHEITAVVCYDEGSLSDAIGWTYEENKIVGMTNSVNSRYGIINGTKPSSGWFI